MIDTLNITLSGPTGSGKSLIGGIIAKVLHERGADVEVLLDGCPAPDSGIDLSGFAVVMREASAPTSGAFEVTGPPVSEMPAEIRSRVIAMGIEPRRVIGLFVDPNTGLLSFSYRNGKKWPHHRQETAEEYAAWKAAESKAKPEADPMPPMPPMPPAQPTILSGWRPAPCSPAAPSTRAIAPSDIRNGDHVRISVSGKAAEQLGIGEIDRNFAQKLVDKIGADHVTVELISRPLAVGDKVVGPYSEDTGTIRHIAHGIAAVEFHAHLGAIALDDLGRAPVAP